MQSTNRGAGEHAQQYPAVGRHGLRDVARQIPKPSEEDEDKVDQRNGYPGAPEDI